MSFVAAIRTCLAKYFTFSGRARRKEYWYFILFIILGSFVAGLLDAALFDTTFITAEGATVQASSDGPTASLFGLVTLIPSLSVGWRRMHDTGRSGFYLLYPIIVMIGIGMFAGMLGGFVPLFEGDFATLLGGGSALIIGIALIILFISPLIVIWWLTRPSEPGANSYGPNPHEVSP